MDEVHATTAAKKAVLARLKAPASADFGNSRFARQGDRRAIVVGQVDAQNSFGVPLRNGFTCELEKQSDGQWRATAVNIISP